MCRLHSSWVSPLYTTMTYYIEALSGTIQLFTEEQNHVVCSRLGAVAPVEHDVDEICQLAVLQHIYLDLQSTSWMLPIRAVVDYGHSNARPRELHVLIAIRPFQMFSWLLPVTHLFYAVMYDTMWSMSMVRLLVTTTKPKSDRLVAETISSIRASPSSPPPLKSTPIAHVPRKLGRS